MALHKAGFHNRNKKDFNAGIMFMVIGGFFWLYATKVDFLGIAGYPIGSAVRMGPAYFPTVLGAMLVTLGLIVFARSFFMAPEPVSSTHWRPLMFILGAACLFGYLINFAGLIIAALVMMIVGSFGGWDFRWKEQVISAVVMTAACAGIFYYGLGLPFRLWPWSF